MENQALTGVFPASAEEIVTTGELTLVKCVGHHACGLVQLRQTYSLAEMYGDNYGYRSGLNSSMVRHLRNKVDKIIRYGILDDGDLVIDIGSNDGTTLGIYPSTYRRVGVDPSAAKFSHFYDKEVDLVVDFFPSDSLTRLIGAKKAKVITAFSMFYDLEDPVSFMIELKNRLDQNGIVVLEQSYLPYMLKNLSFDTICHEHLEYYTLKQIEYIAQKAGMKALEVELNDVNGGSFSVVLTHENSSIEHLFDTSTINKMRSSSDELLAHRLETYSEFSSKVKNELGKLKSFLVNASKEGRSVYGLGASTKGNVLLQEVGIDCTLLKAIAEVNPDKYGRFTPGSHIPIISEDEILQSNPDYLLVLPWHFRDFFLTSEKLRGRKLLMPLPEFELVEV